MATGKDTGTAIGTTGGAVAGSLFGPAGTAIGGAAGGILGGLLGSTFDKRRPDYAIDQASYDLPGYDEELRRRRMLAEQYGQQEISPVARSNFRAQQQGLFDALQRGDLANANFRNSLDAATAQQQALAATGRGNAALAARSASQNASGLAAQLAQQRGVEALQNQQLLGQLLQGARAQDISQNQFDVSSQLQNRSLSQQGQLAALQQAIDLQRAQQEGRIRSEETRAGLEAARIGRPRGSGANDLLGLLKGGAEIYSMFGGGS